MLICRCCLTFEDNLYPFHGNEVAFLECTGLVVEANALICPSCIRKLNEAHAFRVESIRSDEFLKSKHEEMTVEVKIEPVEEEEEKFQYENIFDENDFKREDSSSSDTANETVKKSKPNNKPRPSSPGRSIRAKEAWLYAKDNLIRECPFCFLSGLKKVDLKKHIQEHVDANGGYECDHCQKKFMKKQVLKYHIFARHRILLNLASVNVPVKMTCNECNEIFQGIYLLRRHYREQHPDVQMEEPSVAATFSCSVCDKQLSSKYKLELHEMSHSGKRPYLCQICGKAYKTKDNLRSHERVHLTRYSCETCGKSYRNADGLKYHRYTHEGNPEFACETCGKKFTKLSSVRSHQRTVHIDECDLKFACDSCGKRFKTHKHLRSHLLSHSEQRAHTCEICGLKFRHKSNWKYHKLSHTEQQDYGCGECGTLFKRKPSMKRHMQQHALKLGIDEKSFVLRKGEGRKEVGYLIRN